MDPWRDTDVKVDLFFFWSTYTQKQGTYTHADMPIERGKRKKWGERTDREVDKQLFHQKPSLDSSNSVSIKFKAMGSAKRHEIQRKCVALHWMCWGQS